MKKTWIAAVVAGIVTLASCGGDKPAETAKSEATAPAGGVLSTPDEANGGTITGKVAFTGEKPKMATLASRVGRHVERRHLGFLAGERHLSGDGATVGLVGHGQGAAGRGRGGRLRFGGFRRFIAAASRQ